MRVRYGGGAAEAWRKEYEARAPRDDGLERFARHVVHYDEEDALLLLRGHDADDVRVVEGGEQARFAENKINPLPKPVPLK